MLGIRHREHDRDNIIPIIYVVLLRDARITESLLTVSTAVLGATLILTGAFARGRPVISIRCDRRRISQSPRRDATRRARRGSLPFGLIARQRLRPRRHSTPSVRLLCTRERARTARPALTWSLVTHSGVVAPARLARTWCNYSPQFRVPLSVTVTLRLCPPNARCIQLAHYALRLVCPPRGDYAPALARASFFGLFVRFVLLFSFPFPLRYLAPPKNTARFNCATLLSLN